MEEPAGGGGVSVSARFSVELSLTDSAGLKLSEVE